MKTTFRARAESTRSSLKTAAASKTHRTPPLLLYNKTKKITLPENESPTHTHYENLKRRTVLLITLHSIKHIPFRDTQRCYRRSLVLEQIIPKVKPYFFASL